MLCIETQKVKSRSEENPFGREKKDEELRRKRTLMRTLGFMGLLAPQRMREKREKRRKKPRTKARK